MGVSRGYPIFSGTPYYLRNGKSYGFQIWPVHSEGPSEQKPVKDFREKGAWAYPGTVHRAVIFAIAQLSCITITSVYVRLSIIDLASEALLLRNHRQRSHCDLLVHCPLLLHAARTCRSTSCDATRVCLSSPSRGKRTTAPMMLVN